MKIRTQIIKKDLCECLRVVALSPAVDSQQSTWEETEKMVVVVVAQAPQQQDALSTQENMKMMGEKTEYTVIELREGASS